MATHWARKQAHTNELATFLENTWARILSHKEIAAVSALGAIVILAIGLYSFRRYQDSRDSAWTKLALAQSYAYSGQAALALEQLKSLSEEQPASAAAGYGSLLASDILFEEEKYNDAAASYQQLTAQPSQPSLLPLALAGFCLSQEAAQNCQKAVETEQRFLNSYQDHFLAPQIHGSLARCWAALGQMDRAKSAYERMAFLYPDTYWSQWAKTHLKS